MPFIKKIPETIEEQQEQWCKSIPKRFHNTYRKAIAGRSLRAAINAKCHACMSFQIKEVHRCEVVTCPLWVYRPQSRVKNRGVALTATVGARNES